MRKFIVMALMVVFVSCKKENESNQITMTTARTEVEIRLAGVGIVTLDWGDGSPEETVTHGGLKEFNHSYSSETLHTITITGDKIVDIRCQGIQLTTLNVSKNSTLQTLECGWNQLTSLNVSGHINLSYLECSTNYMNATALNALFTSLPTVASGSIYVHYNGPNYDSSGDRDCDVTIAENKGWNVYKSTWIKY